MRLLVLPILSLLAACAPPPVEDSGSEPLEDTSSPPAPSTPTVLPEPECADGSIPTDTVPHFCGSVPRNLLFVSIDTLRRDHVDRYGSQQLTPFLDGLMSEGFTLDDHMQCSNWTFESITCTLLGRQTWEAGFVGRLSSALNSPLPDGTPMLASWLAEIGFHGILVSANGWLAAEWNNEQGYASTVVKKTRIGGVWDEARARLERALDEELVDRWFLHMHLFDPHSPYSAPDDYNVGYDALEPVPWDLTRQTEHYESIGEWGGLTEDERALLEEHLRVLYAGEVRYTDAQLAEVFAELDAAGWLDDTLVVVWSDHGEAFWEHGAATHAHWLYGEENDALAFFWAKNIVPGRWPGPTSAIDLVPTLLSLYGVPRPPEVTGLAVGEASPNRVREAVAVARKGVVQSVRQGPHRLQFRWGTGDVIVSDLDADPLELQNHVGAPSPVAQDLWQLLLPRITQLQPLVPDREVTWPEGFPTE